MLHLFPLGGTKLSLRRHDPSLLLDHVRSYLCNACNLLHQMLHHRYASLGVWSHLLSPHNHVSRAFVVITTSLSDLSYGSKLLSLRTKHIWFLTCSQLWGYISLMFHHEHGPFSVFATGLVGIVGVTTSSPGGA